MTASNVPAFSRGDQPYPAAPGGFTQVVGSRWAELCQRHRLSLGARALLMELLLAADRRTESVGYYTQDGWAEVLGVHRNSVRKLQRELEQAGCIVVAKVPRACHYSVLITCWAEVVHQPKGSSSAQDAGRACTPIVQGVHNPSAQVQGFRAPRYSEVDRAPDQVSSNSSSASPSAPLVALALAACSRTSRREAEAWVGRQLGAGCSVEQLQLALEDARTDGNVLYLSWVEKRLTRYQGAAQRPTEPAAPTWCTACYEVYGEPYPIGNCRCEGAQVIELQAVAS